MFDVKKLFCTVFIVLIFILLSQSSFAYNQRLDLNLGNTSGIDSILPPPGLYLSNYIANYSANDFKNEKGNNLKLPGGDDPDLNAVIYAPQIIYVHNNKIFDNYSIGFQFMPTVLQSYNLDSDVLSANSATLGDMNFGPWIGRTENFGNNFRLNWIVEFDTYFPTGNHDKDDDLNPGNDFWTFEPWVSLSLQMPYGFTLGTRQMVTYNTEGSDSDIQPGIAYHTNYSLWKSLKPIAPSLQIGIVGYYLDQLEEDELNGEDQENSEEKVSAIGPALSWRAPSGTTVRLKAYFEDNVENRPEGQKILLRIIQKLW
ncbi:MAG: transporter [Desulfohalobiaceae bacterium]